ncbi:amino acid adenylation domain-containing protein [uncultured Dubosiella sp.]|uniref:amino acid adenylation domain-containing protein n=1 Tax=uncultured Dubosiella sp. TaxID=1937011 RepID=UPI0025D4B507|nr:amino acid adenylation domain-containing protein [uncultured Dubosiella sp.]
MENTLYGLLKETAQQFPQAPALIEGNQTLTFSQLLDLVDQKAACFPPHIKSIGIIMDHGIEMIVSMFAVLKCGARYIPAEPTFPIKRIRFMMKEADVDFILTNPACASMLDGFMIRTADTSCTEVDTIDHARPESAAYVLYTSGTTGRPKGVCVTNANVCHYVRAFEHEFHIGPGDIMLQYSVCSFDIFVEEVFASLLNGASLAIPSSQDKHDLRSLMKFVEKHNVTIISGFPYLLAEMNRLEKIPSSLRLLISGGDVLRSQYIDHLLAQVEVYNTYGPSETTVCAAYYKCTEDGMLEDGTYPIGHSVQGTQIRILDENGNEVSKGHAGEICILGDGVSSGYIGSHKKENEAFVTLADNTRMYRSGDLGYVLPDGNLAFLHRKDTQIMIYGKRVEVSEVESVLCQCSGIAEAIVRPYEDEHHLSYMIAYIVPDQEDICLSSLKKELSQTLVSFMIPEFFVQMDHIPLNANGKPDDSQLPVVLKDGE